MKTYVKIIILIATLGVGFGIGWFCRYQMFDASFTQVYMHEVVAEDSRMREAVQKYTDVNSRWKQGMKPSEFLMTIKEDLFEI